MPAHYPANKHYPEIRLLLGDQLNHAHHWFDEVSDHRLYVLAELRQETDYTRHHVQKVCAFFLAMQRFATALEESGHHVLYLTLDETRDFHSLPELLDFLVTNWGATSFQYIDPDELRLRQQLRNWQPRTQVAVSSTDSQHFLIPDGQLGDYFPPGQNHVMEHFYRRVRRLTGILMTGEKPLGGRWNFDAENRKKLPDKVPIPDPLLFGNPAGDILDRLSRHRVSTIGRCEERLVHWPVDRTQSLALLEHFTANCLPFFGQYQDAMTHRGWSLFHSRLSFSLNTKLLHPREVVDAAINAFEADPDTISLAQVEGFVRQIIGWREFMRGIYWTYMPDYETLNALKHTNPLPDFYWTGATKMACMSHAINQSLDHAYAHHIQRLMVTGNFALLAGVDPDEVDEWYLGIYADAIQWVEITNTRGMSQFADGGIVATKPYISSGKYIQRMGHYCPDCHYDPNRRSGNGACPFNVFYWQFLDRHRTTFETNHRMRMMYANLERIPTTEIETIRATAEQYQQCINAL
ncbi:MAG: cryptochrome/photolyase family protein [Pseudomonadota bacterium]